MSAYGAAVRPWPREALVVFSGAAHLWWLRWLRPGFRHCFVVLRFAGSWVVVDPLSHQTEIAVFEAVPRADVEAIYRRRGLTVVACPVRPAARLPAPWRPHTCVEVAKRLLGLRAPWVFTPWQLYRLISPKKMEKIIDVIKNKD